MFMRKYKSSTAFPSEQTEENQHNKGITVREYFTAKALQGLLTTMNEEGFAPNEPNVIYLTQLAVKAADETLKLLGYE